MALTTCGHLGCTRHPYSAKPSGWLDRPLLCRLSFHAHYKEVRYGDPDYGSEFTCLCCGYRWKHDDRTMIGFPE